MDDATLSPSEPGKESAKSIGPYDYVEPGQHTVRVQLGDGPKDTVITVDGRQLEHVERLTLTMHAGQSGPAALTFVRARANADASDVEHDVVEFRTSDGHDAAIAGAVRLIEETARESLVGPGLSPLHAFMVATNGSDRAVTLGEIIRDAERYRALRAALEDPRAELTLRRVEGAEFVRDRVFTDDDGRAVDGFDSVADELRASEQLERDTPRLPT